MNSSSNIKLNINEKKRTESSKLNSSLLFVASWQNKVTPFGEENFPTDVMRYILLNKQALDDRLAPALSHVANGEYDQLKILLDEDAYLVLLRGDVTTPGGLTIKNTTLLECAIGAGDWSINWNSPGMVELIMDYFEGLNGGEAALKNQLERCKTCLDELENQKPFDLTGLMDIIKNSSDEDIKNALGKKNNDSLFCKEIIKFRDAVRPGIITEPHMHYNYQTLIHAFYLFDKEWNYLDRNKRNLFWRQVIGYLQRSLPAVDRFIFAKASLYELVERCLTLERTSVCMSLSRVFPSCSAGDADCTGLGFDVGIYGYWDDVGGLGRGGASSKSVGGYKNLCKTRISVLQSLYRKFLNSKLSTTYKL
jgi:hypothetical protein